MRPTSSKFDVTVSEDYEYGQSMLGRKCTDLIFFFFYGSTALYGSGPSR
jgi:hypothetical protein